MEWIGLVVLVLGLAWWVANGDAGPGDGQQQTSPAGGETRVDRDSEATSVPLELPADDFVSVARESGWFVDPLPQWMVTAAEQWLGANRSSVVPLRNTGEPLDKDEKRALGVSTNAKLGRDYVDALSEAGRADRPLRAIEVCLHRARNRRARKRTLQQAAESGGEASIQIVTADEQRRCQAVDAIADQVYRLSEVPRLPVDGCDALDCACTYQIVSDSADRGKR